MKQQNLKIRIQQLLATLTVGIVLVGCSAKDKKNIDSSSTNNQTSSSISNSQSYESNSNNNPESMTSETEEFDYFNSAKQELQELIESKKLEEAKEKGKDYFITGVDFVFYDKEIKGITFDDLTEEGKKVTLENLEIMDGWVEAISPNYKDKIGEKYKIVKDFVSEKYYDAIDVIKQSLGEENYDLIQDQKNQLKDKLSTSKDKTLEKISDWYQNYKTNK